MPDLSSLVSLQDKEDKATNLKYFINLNPDTSLFDIWHCADNRQRTRIMLCQYVWLVPECHVLSRPLNYL